MSTMKCSVALLCFLTCGFCHGQAPNDAQPAPSNVMGAAYPRVDSEDRVTFQLRAPEAQRVQVQVYHGQYDLTKGWRASGA
jgi:enterochelin esterase family protein